MQSSNGEGARARGKDSIKEVPSGQKESGALSRERRETEPGHREEDEKERSPAWKFQHASRAPEFAAHTSTRATCVRRWPTTNADPEDAIAQPNPGDPSHQKLRALIITSLRRRVRTGVCWCVQKKIGQQTLVCADEKKGTVHPPVLQDYKNYVLVLICVTPYLIVKFSAWLLSNFD